MQQKKNNEEGWRRRQAAPPMTEERKRLTILLYDWIMLYSETLAEEYPDWTEEQVREKALELAKAKVFKTYPLEIKDRQQARLNRQYAMRTGDLRKPLTYEELIAWSAAYMDKKNRAWEAETYDPKNNEARRKELLRLHELDKRYWKGVEEIVQAGRNSSPS